jgi:hypothetical protein
MEGFLTKRGSFIQSWKVRWFELRDNNLSYYKDQLKSTHKGTLTLDSSSSVELSPDLGSFRNVLIIHGVGHSMAVCADSAVTKMSWHRALCSVIEKLKFEKEEERKIAATLDKYNTTRGQAMSTEDMNTTVSDEAPAAAPPVRGKPIRLRKPTDAELPANVFFDEDTSSKTGNVSAGSGKISSASGKGHRSAPSSQDTPLADAENVKTSSGNWRKVCNT